MSCYTAAREPPAHARHEPVARAAHEEESAMAAKTTVTIPADLSLEIDEEVVAQKRVTGRTNVTKQEIVVAGIRAYLAALRTARSQQTPAAHKGTPDGDPRT